MKNKHVLTKETLEDPEMLQDARIREKDTKIRASNKRRARDMYSSTRRYGRDNHRRLDRDFLEEDGDDEVMDISRMKKSHRHGSTGLAEDGEEEEMSDGEYEVSDRLRRAPAAALPPPPPPPPPASQTAETPAAAPVSQDTSANGGPADADAEQPQMDADDEMLTPTHTGKRKRVLIDDDDDDE